jgi:pantetheine-phosphate adenylyltransferase
MNAVYAGSFDPFTNGHLEIYKQANTLFNKVIILLASNPGKIRSFDANEMVKAIKKTTKNDNVYIFDSGLVADFCKENNIFYLVRGLRNTSDYMYEEIIAKTNEAIFPDLETIYFRSKNEIISSSMIKLFLANKKDVSNYVPEEIRKIL